MARPVCSCFSTSTSCRTLVCRLLSWLVAMDGRFIYASATNQPLMDRRFTNALTASITSKGGGAKGCMPAVSRALLTLKIQALTMKVYRGECVF